MGIRAASFAFVLTCALLGSTAQGAELPPIAFLSMGFKEATMADFASEPEVFARRADPSGYLAVTADFNGDGKVDEARILLNEQRQVAYVVAVIQTVAKIDTYVLSHMPLHDVKNVGIAPAKPLAADRSRGLPGLTIFALDSGRGEARYFDGEEFDTRVAVVASDLRI